MFLSLIALITFTANAWLSWSLGSWLGIGTFLVLIPVSIMITVGGGVALGLVAMVFGKHDDRTRWQRFLRNFLKGWAWLVCVVWLLPWALLGFIQFTNNTAAATLPKITISNGEKTVVFQSMIHIGSPGFYDDIERDMDNLRGRDFIFFYEGVREGTPESMTELSGLMGMNISEKMYSVFAQMSGLVIQDAQRYIGIIPGRNVDLSTDEIVALAQAENIPSPLPVESTLLTTIEKKYPTLTPFQKTLAQIMSRGVLNVLLKTYTNPALEQSLKQQVPVFDIILDRRNEVLVTAILESPIPNIYIHYGALHYPGVLERLVEKDPRWREIAKTEFQVIR